MNRKEHAGHVLRTIIIISLIIIVKYCAKVMQAKCANFILCSCELSLKVRSKVCVTIQGFLSEIHVSVQQRALFRRTRANFLGKFAASFREERTFP